MRVQWCVSDCEIGHTFHVEWHDGGWFLIDRSYKGEERMFAITGELARTLIQDAEPERIFTGDKPPTDTDK